MTKRIALALVAFIIAAALFLPFTVRAATEFSWAKNKFGIHLLDNANDIKSAAELINSHGGDWGWVVLVLRDNDLNRDKWQNIFNRCRRYHLLPIIRLATHAQGQFWIKPTLNTVNREAQFINQLNWPSQERLVIIFNEPNRGDEWSGKASPREYAQILSYSLKIFRQQSKKYFILNAGLDLAAPQQPPQFISAANFYKAVIYSQPRIFEQLDGLASHSYPNHGFRGSANDWGRTSIHGYAWELAYLQRLGVSKKLPVFITETGWPHREGIKKNHSYLPAKYLKNHFRQAFKNWLRDKRVAAFTPFLLNYSLPPMDHFSWQKPNGQYYPYASVLKNWPKEANHPLQIDKAMVVTADIPILANPNQHLRGRILLKNIGQQIWGEKQKVHCLRRSNSEIKSGNLCAKLAKPIEPGNQTWFSFPLISPAQSGKYFIEWQNLKLSRRFFIIPEFYFLELPTNMNFAFRFILEFQKAIMGELRSFVRPFLPLYNNKIKRP